MAFRNFYLFYSNQRSWKICHYFKILRSLLYPNEKVFDVAVGKKTIINNIDIFAVAGKAIAHDEYIEMELKNDKVYVNGVEAPSAYEPKNKLLKLKFVKGEKDNPKINAILIYKGDIMGICF
jgi:hypothetical protein